jgi:hypothetical protein
MSSNSNSKMLSFNKLFKKAKRIDPSIKYRSITKKQVLEIIQNSKSKSKSKSKYGKGIKKSIQNTSDLAVFENKDKEFHETWTSVRKPMNITHPFRCILSGPPSCGKTSMIMNLLMSNDPEFEEVIVVHCDPEYTQEYDDLNAIMCDEIPAPNEWEGKKKTLVILDDLEYKQMSKDQKRNLDRLFGFVSTHKNISVCLSSQDIFQIPTACRRCTNLWCLWRMDDMDSIKVLSRKINLSAKSIQYLFDKYLTDTHDSIMIDNTHKSPYPIRKNGTQLIDFSNTNI